MNVNYKRLWKLLIDKDMKKQDLQKAANISAVTIAKLGKNENVTTSILTKICTALECNVGDIMDIDDSENEGAAKQEELFDGNQNS
ncbi:MAG: helix-turn-helix transcriptional regulator [Anaerovoracaceae bacterium]